MPLLRWGTLGTSAALHAAVALAAGGHAPGGAARSAAPDVTVPVELLPDVAQAPALEKDSPDGPRQPGPPAFPTHKHDYPMPPGHDRPHDPSFVHVVKSPEAPTDTPPPSTPVVALGEPTTRFVLGTVPALRPPGGSAAGAVHSGGTGNFEGTAVETLPESAVSAPARLLSAAEVVYPAEARAADVERDVVLSIVVDHIGAVVDARALSREGYGLEDAAVRAVRSYRFSPAQREGHAVRVRMRWVVQFRLR